MYCDNPQHIYNKYLHRFILVPCGCCESCRITRANTLAQRVQNECDQHKYNIFFTLTYDNEHVPYITPDCDGIHDKSGRSFISPLDDERLLNSLDDLRNDYPTNRPLTNFGDDSCVGVLVKADIQKFIKKLRSAITYKFDYLIEQYGKDYFNEKTHLRYFICGEFGTRYKRPHYHGILHVNDEQVAEFARQNILSSWRFCDWDEIKRLEQKDGRKRLPSYVANGTASGYVSSYVNSGYSNSNDLECRSFFKTFCVYSKKPLYGCSTFDKETIISFANGNFDTEVSQIVTKSIKGELRDTVNTLSPALLRSLFPRFSGIDTTTDDALLQLCKYDSQDKPRHEFFTKCRSFCKRFLGGYSIATMQKYIMIYHRIYARVKSYMIGQHMQTFKYNNPLDYIKSCYHTFEDSPNNPCIMLKRVINDLFCVDLFTHPLSAYDYGEDYYFSIRERKLKYHAKLLPKHYNSYINGF